VVQPGRATALRDGRIFAREWGDPGTQTILCWHGAGGSSADYARIGPELAELLKMRVVAIDAPGHVQSPPCSAAAYRPSALASLAAEVLDELAVERAVFLGFSWGATVGCWLGARAPERLLGIALIEGGHMDFADLHGFRTDRTLEDFTADAEAAELSEGAAFGNHTPAVAGAMIYGLCQEPVTATYPGLSASGIPTLFVGAQRDELPGPLDRLARLVPQCEIVQLGSPSHELLRDAPNGVARAIGDWLGGIDP
jgi:pimeloyl-ACP methyl ester carboxylesterase